MTYKGDLFTYLLGFFGSIWAHNTYGPVWAHMGPARALEEQYKFRKNAFVFYVTHFSKKSSFVSSRQHFLQKSIKKRVAFFLNFSRSSRARAGPIRAQMGPKDKKMYAKNCFNRGL